MNMISREKRLLDEMETLEYENMNEDFFQLSNNLIQANKEKEGQFEAMPVKHVRVDGVV